MDSLYQVRLRNLLEMTAERIRPCKQCNAELFFVRNRNGALIPFTAKGENHFIDCPHADEFRNKNGHPAKPGVQQAALFDKAPLPR